MNPISGDWIGLFTYTEGEILGTGGEIITNEEENVFFIKEIFEEYEPKDFEIRLFKLENNRIIPLYNEKVYGYGIKNAKWISNTEITFDNYVSGDIDYFNHSYQGLYSPQKLTIDNGNVTKFEDNSQYETNRLRDDFMNNDEIVLYEEISNELKVIDTIDYSNVISSHLTKIFSFVDSEIVVWYEIKTKEGTEAFTYKKISDMKEILCHRGFILLADDSLVKSPFYGFLMYDDYEDLGYYLVKSFYLGNTYKLMSKDGVADIYSYNYPVVSPAFYFIASADLNLINTTFSQESFNGNYFQIHAFNQVEAEGMYLIKLGEWMPKSIKWIGNYEIELITQNAYDGNEKINHFYFLNGEWQSDDFPDEHSSKYYISIDTDIINIRNVPSIDADVVGQGQLDDQYLVLDVHRDELGDYWYKIDECKWISSRYCRFSFDN